MTFFCEPPVAMMAQSPSKSLSHSSAAAITAHPTNEKREEPPSSANQVDLRPSTPWTGPIPFEVLDPFTNAYSVTNLLEYVSNPLVYSNRIIRFSPSFTLDDAGLKDIKNAIIKSAEEHSGGIIRLEGTRIQKVPSWSFCCIHAGIYRGSKFDEHGNELPVDEGENSCFHPDPTTKIDRRKLARKSPGTSRRFSVSQPRCPFRLTINRDDKSYFFKGGKGCANHQYHHRVDPSTAAKKEKPKKVSSGRRGRPPKNNKTNSSSLNQATPSFDSDDGSDFEQTYHDDDDDDRAIEMAMTAVDEQQLEVVQPTRSAIVCMAEEMNSLLTSAGHENLTNEIIQKQAELLQLTKTLVEAQSAMDKLNRTKRTITTKTNSSSTRKRRKKAN